MTAQFYYLDGNIMKIGDIVEIDGNHTAVVHLILTAGTELARAHGLENSSGFALIYDDGTSIIMKDTDIDLVLKKRGKDKNAEK